MFGYTLTFYTTTPRRQVFMYERLHWMNHKHFLNSVVRFVYSNYYFMENLTLRNGKAGVKQAKQIFITASEEWQIHWGNRLAYIVFRLKCFYYYCTFPDRLKTEMISYRFRRCVCTWQHVSGTKTFRFRNESRIFRSIAKGVFL